ncbi:chemotaxis protein CheA [Acidithiobacillus thiooxidans]|uniref:chemotaxis protein CheA n=1 Tax=Acidithiobacillus thiooxidans TaxID=930 RepID=UPI001C06EC4E|nr:chemotaxis protein CheA [Acidithiobacillus thiooxidans]MBU2793125.1 chemotaxis protein CheA [Acidithiobacillus thiooxidans]
MDMEILQDFLPEAAELLENAQSEALTLENNPDDANAIAALFRAFHTLKGGAGFLEAANMVDWCHHLEDLLDKIRSGKLRITPEMSDVILKGIDVVQRMLGELGQGGYPTPGPEDLGNIVKEMAAGQYVAAPVPKPAETAVPVVESVEDSTENKDSAAGVLLMERRPREDGTSGLFLQQTGGQTKDNGSADGNASGVITDDEFERYLDQMYAGGKIPGDIPVERQGLSAPVPSAPPLVSTTLSVPAPKKPETSTERTEVGESTLRVEAARLDAVMNQVGELVLLRNRFAAAVQEMAQENEDMSRIAREMDLTVNDMQGTVMRLRMQPCKRLFQQLPRVVRDVARQLNKQVNLIIEGEGVEIDKTVVDALSAPLVHLVRNSMDHGIELPADRKMLGKPECATLRVAAIHLGDKVRIEVSDDGKGIDRQFVTRKAIEKGLITSEEAARLSEQEAVELIFRPGFSTNDAVTEFSGRGVGMDVVKETTHQLRGRLDVRTELGRGTTIAMEFPLTLAVLPVLYLRLRRDTYALPISAVESLLEVELGRLHQLQGRALYRVNNEQIVPLLDLGSVLHGKPLRIGNEPTDGILTERGLLVVSEVLGNEDSVVKPMDFMPEGNWYQGATISGKGDVVLILDVGAVVRTGLAQEPKEMS